MQDKLNKVADKLHSHYALDEAKQIALLLLEKLSGLSRVQLLTRDLKLDEEQNQQLAVWIDRLHSNEPVQYVLGETEFFGLPFKVNPAVLIPRPETEELVEWILEDLSAIPAKNTYSLLDIGTGSGCIPITIKKKMSELSVSALDVSPEALAVARENANLNGVEVKLLEEDILNPQGVYSLFDVIVSNPPYVPSSDADEMDERVKNKEPHLALFVSDQDSLIFYRKIVQFAQNQLQIGGKLYFETHYRLADKVKTLLESMGFKDVLVRKDISGNERMVRAER